MQRLAQRFACGESIVKLGGKLSRQVVGDLPQRAHKGADLRLVEQFVCPAAQPGETKCRAPDIAGVEKLLAVDAILNLYFNVASGLVVYPRLGRRRACPTEARLDATVPRRRVLILVPAAASRRPERSGGDDVIDLGSASAASVGQARRRARGQSRALIQFPPILAALGASPTEASRDDQTAWSKLCNIEVSELL